VFVLIALATGQKLKKQNIELLLMFS